MFEGLGFKRGRRARSTHTSTGTCTASLLLLWLPVRASSKQVDLYYSASPSYLEVNFNQLCCTDSDL
jgi:hypothetical protein